MRLGAGFVASETSSGRTAIGRPEPAARDRQSRKPGLELVHLRDLDHHPAQQSLYMECSLDYP